MFSRKLSKESSAHQPVDRRHHDSHEVVDAPPYDKNKDELRRHIDKQLEQQQSSDLFREMEKKQGAGTDHVDREGRLNWLDDEIDPDLKRIDKAKEKLPELHRKVIEEIKAELDREAAKHAPNFTKGRHNLFSGHNSKDRNTAQFHCTDIATKIRALATICEKEARNPTNLNKLSTQNLSNGAKIEEVESQTHLNIPYQQKHQSDTNIQIVYDPEKPSTSKEKEEFKENKKLGVEDFKNLGQEQELTLSEFVTGFEQFSGEKQQQLLEILQLPKKSRDKALKIINSAEKLATAGKRLESALRPYGNPDEYVQGKTDDMEVALNDERVLSNLRNLVAQFRNSYKELRKHSSRPLMSQILNFQDNMDNFTIHLPKVTSSSEIEKLQLKNLFNASIEKSRGKGGTLPTDYSEFKGFIGAAKLFGNSLKAFQEHINTYEKISISDLAQAASEINLPGEVVITEINRSVTPIDNK